MSMTTDLHAHCCTPQEIALDIFTGEQVALVAQASSRLPKDWQKNGDFLVSTNAWHNDPGFKEALRDAKGRYTDLNLNCLAHGIKPSSGAVYTPDIDAHLRTVLTQAQAEYPGALNLMPIIDLAIFEYNANVLITGGTDMVFFKYDRKTRSCYLDGNDVLRAFDYYNSARKDPRLPNIPRPVTLSDAMHNAHGYTGNISDRGTEQDLAPSIIDLLHRDESEPCTQNNTPQVSGCRAGTALWSAG